VKRPTPTERDLLRRFNAAVNDALSYGITSVHDAGLKPVSLDFFRRSIKHYCAKTYLTLFMQAGGSRKSSRKCSRIPSLRCSQ